MFVLLPLEILFTFQNNGVIKNNCLNVLNYYLHFTVTLTQRNIQAAPIIFVKCQKLSFGLVRTIDTVKWIWKERSKFHLFVLQQNHQMRRQLVERFTQATYFRPKLPIVSGKSSSMTGTVTCLLTQYTPVPLKSQCPPAAVLKLLRLIM